MPVMSKHFKHYGKMDMLYTSTIKGHWYLNIFNITEKWICSLHFAKHFCHWYNCSQLGRICSKSILKHNRYPLLLFWYWGKHMFVKKNASFYMFSMFRSCNTNHTSFSRPIKSLTGQLVSQTVVQILRE